MWQQTKTKQPPERPFIASQVVSAGVYANGRLIWWNLDVFGDGCDCGLHFACCWKASALDNNCSGSLNNRLPLITNLIEVNHSTVGSMQLVKKKQKKLILYYAFLSTKQKLFSGAKLFKFTLI